MLTNLMNLLFGCTHRHTTFPISPRAKALRRQADHFDTYVVCLDCGKEMAYSWEEMRVLPESSSKPTASVPEQVGSFSVSK